MASSTFNFLLWFLTLLWTLVWTIFHAQISLYRDFRLSLPWSTGNLVHLLTDQRSSVILTTWSPTAAAVNETPAVVPSDRHSAYWNQRIDCVWIRSSWSNGGRRSSSSCRRCISQQGLVESAGRRIPVSVTFNLFSSSYVIDHFIFHEHACVVHSD
jgi:hypothetical protein